MLKHLVWMAFILVIISCLVNRCEKEQAQRGEAISKYLYRTQGLKIPPEEARWLLVTTNQYDLDLHDIDIFMPSKKQWRKIK